VYGERGVIASLPRRHPCFLEYDQHCFGQTIGRQPFRSGQRYVSAPVFGRPDLAAAGRLYAVAAGAADALETVEPLLNAVAQRTFTVSRTPEAANLIKLSGNFLIASVIESVGEPWHWSARPV